MVHVFEPFRLDVGAGRLLRGEVPVALRPKAWAVLVHLVENAGRLVTKEELLDAVWPGVALNEEAAAQHVREVRTALGDTGRPSQFVETVHRRGFRFVAPVRHESNRTRSVEVRSGALHTAWATLGLSPEGVSCTETLVGRRQELAAITAALPRARSGRPILIGVSGEPGIGKTRLLAEASRLAAEDGFRVLAGCCFEAEGQPPFWPWAQVLRGIARADSSEERSSLPSWANVDLATLVPQVAASPAATIRAHDTQEARLRLFEAVLETLRAAAAHQPLLLLIDDLHWADPASLALLQTAVGDVESLPLAVLGSYRTDEGRATRTLKSIVAWLDRCGRFEHVAVPGLAEDETGALLRLLAGAAIDEPLIHAVHGRTGGNPYFTAELWQHLLDEGAVLARDGAFSQTVQTRTVPEGVRATIGLRLERLSEGCLGFLKVASVCGVEFDFDVVCAVAAMETGVALTAIEDAERARIVSEAPARPGRYRFTHALARDCLYEGLGGLRRAHLHWTIGEELERRYGADAPSYAAELSHHFTSGATRGDAEKALHHAIAAARQATAGCAYELAVDHLERALRVVGDAGSAADPSFARQRRRELLLELAESHERSGDGARARECFEEAAALAREDGDALHFARAALGMVTRWTFDDAVAIRHLEEAIENTGTGDASMRARLLARLAQALYVLPDSRARRESLCEQALALARDLGDASLLGQVLADCLEALFHCDNVAERESLASALYAAATTSGNTTLQLQAHTWRIVGSLSRGRLGDAEDEVATFCALARSARQPRFLGIASVFEGALEIARGRLAAAEEHSRTAARWGERFSEYHAAMVAFIQLFTIRREQGRTLGLESEDRSIRVPESGHPSSTLFTRSALWLLPFSLAEEGRLDEARIAFDEAARKLDELPPENARSSRTIAIASMSDAAATFGDRMVARELLPLTAPYVDQWVVVGFGAHVGVSFQNVRGSLLGVLGEWDDSVAHFERAIAECERERAVFAESRALHNYARMLVQRGRPQDRRKALMLIERGERISGPAGFVTALGKFARLRASLGPTRASARHAS